jgi:hypothetical protein
MSWVKLNCSWMKWNRHLENFKKCRHSISALILSVPLRWFDLLSFLRFFTLSGNDIEQTANTYKLNACNKALNKLESQTWAIILAWIKTTFYIDYC